jgi:hypothetical protein
MAAPLVSYTHGPARPQAPAPVLGSGSQAEDLLGTSIEDRPAPFRAECTAGSSTKEYRTT